MNWLLALHNAIDYPLRQFFRWQRPVKTQPRQDKTPALQCQPAEWARLCVDYHLEGWLEKGTLEAFSINLYYLQLIEQALLQAGAPLPDPLNAVDVGCSDWFYAPALWAALRWFGHAAGRQLDLSGYEVDAFRVYGDLHARRDHALAHIAGLPGLTYLPQGFTPRPAAYDLAFQFFPFIFVRDHLEWGLPQGLFDPAALCAQVWQSLRPGGLLVIVNQGEAEHAAQRAMLERLGVQPLAAFPFASPFYTYKIPHFILVARREISR